MGIATFVAKCFEKVEQVVIDDECLAQVSYDQGSYLVSIRLEKLSP